ncbi:MAG: DUF2510 domain-containing protein [Acidimicrobiales bacterium]
MQVPTLVRPGQLSTPSPPPVDAIWVRRLRIRREQPLGHLAVHYSIRIPEMAREVTSCWICSVRGIAVPRDPSFTADDPCSEPRQGVSGPDAVEPAPATSPADWYPDPYGQHRLRYFDGAAWTGHTAD